MEPQYVVRHGSYTWEDPSSDRLRQLHCLCLRCERMKPGSAGHCEVARALYQVCVDANMALMITRCKFYERKE